ncbi:MAG: serpin family protein, partial [Bacteroidota bacterium]
MKKNFSFVFFALLSIVLILLLMTLIQCSAGLTEPEKNNDVRALSKAEEDIVSSSASFGLNLIKEISKTEPDNNVIISPLSVSTAFGMVLNGANGKTYDEIKSTLGLQSGSLSGVNQAYQSLSELLTQIDPHVIFESANSIWYRQGVTFEQSFFDVNKKYFDALVQELDFANPSSVDIINNWVREKTKEKIKSIIDQIPPEAVMYLINAIYFKGTWLYTFDKNATKEENFYVTPDNSVKCMMMSQKSKFNYYSAEDYQAIELPYGNGDFSMLVILPAMNNNINAFVNQMDEKFWSLLLDNMKEREVNLWLPKFELEYKIKLNDALIAMGIKSAFDPYNADFSKMRKEKDIFISRVLHKTYIKIDEEGTEAAAVTAIEMGTTSVGGSKEIYMRVNHPFI